MMQDDRNHVPRHQDALAYLEGLGEEGAAVVRTREGGYERYWQQYGELALRKPWETAPHD